MWSTTDGGSSWQKELTGYFFGVSFLGDTQGWAGGWGGVSATGQP